MQFLLSRPCNLILYNLIWLGCVLGRDQLVVPVSILVTGYLALLVYHGRMLPQQIVLPAAIGIGVDLVLTLSGLFAFGNAPLIIPLWLIVLWLAFSSTLVLSLDFLGRNKWLAALAGAVAFPVNYSVGERLDAVAFGQPAIAIAVTLACIWALLLPMLFMITRQFREVRCEAR